MAASGEELRDLLRRFPTGVAVVTVDLEGERLGLTIGTLVELSFAPPLVGFAVRREAALHELVRRSGDFGLNLLAADQIHVAQHFARGVPPIALWEGIEVRESSGPPLIAGAIGWLIGRIASEVPAGEHTFFVGDVLSVEQGVNERRLVYIDRGYASV
ncbi:MAG TPA: flavin reductase family protein [Gaiellaceae bacterium]|nr:flavin reductase family protein [Gaiellaceae bacterium]